mmetsp:Transcript_16888/g.25801  ORF Transcript_16888/g.25801 Transcript_16888/m.25801 type:complete len:109 (+) Transcript_16888:461-787(+)
MFVDGYEFEAYKALGLGRFDELKDVKMGDVGMTAPKMGGFGGWWNYLTNVASLAPGNKDTPKEVVLEGVTRTGGTYVISGDDIIYQWNDAIPGETPVVAEVLELTTSS